MKRIMFKKRALVVLLAAGLLAGCNQPRTDGMDYEQATDVPTTPYEMYVIGSHFNSWDPGTIKDTNNFKFQTVTGTSKLAYEITITQAMHDEWFGFKFIESNAWTVQYGMEDVDIENCNSAFKTLIGFTTVEAYRETYHEGKSNRSNVAPASSSLTVGAKLKITYDPFNYKADGDYSYHFVLDYIVA